MSDIGPSLEQTHDPLRPITRTRRSPARTLQTLELPCATAPTPRFLWRRLHARCDGRVSLELGKRARSQAQHPPTVLLFVRDTSRLPALTVDGDTKALVPGDGPGLEPDGSIAAVGIAPCDGSWTPRAIAPTMPGGRSLSHNPRIAGF
jgi:hypothetical protein